MLMRRVIACLDVREGRVVKGTRFVGLRDVGDPVELAQRYEAQGADEIVFLDITATHEQRGTVLDLLTVLPSTCLCHSPWGEVSARPTMRRARCVPEPTR